MIWIDNKIMDKEYLKKTLTHFEAFSDCLRVSMTSQQRIEAYCECAFDEDGKLKEPG